MIWRNAMDCPMKHWPKSSSDLPQLGVLMSHHGIKGGYTLARDPRYISVFDVIKSSDRPRRSSLHSERQQRLGTGNGYHQLRMVSQLVEDMLHELTIEDIEEKASSPADS